MVNDSLEYLVMAMKSPEIQSKRIKGIGKMPFEEGDVIAHVISESWYLEIYNNSVSYIKYNENDETMTVLSEDNDVIKRDVFFVSAELGRYYRLSLSGLIYRLQIGNL